MITITEKYSCCGCNACVSICPRGCILMKADEEGFLYPCVDASKCINCGLCEKVCPFQVEREPKRPINTYAAINPDEKERLSSSSGGVFSLLVRKVLEDGGTVFGAAFGDQWEVHHIAIEHIDEIYKLQGSKYVQSSIGDVFRLVRQCLEGGKKVLFSGTACQVAGLNLYLQKKYDNLLTVDVVCHGVPSPRVWKAYVNYLKRNNSAFPLWSDYQLERISFRDKRNGWKDYCFLASYLSGGDNGEREIQDYQLRESFRENTYMRGFLNNLFLRPSCYKCMVRSGRCGSDLTLGDFWGIGVVHPELDDDKGVSLVLTNSYSGEECINSVGAMLFKTEYDNAVKFNPCLTQSVNNTKYRAKFWSLFTDDTVIDSIMKVVKQMQPSCFTLLYREVKEIIGSVFRKNK